MGKILKAEDGDVKEALNVLIKISSKLDRKEGLDKLESEYLFQCLSKVIESVEKPCCKKATINNSFNLYEKQDLTSLGANGSKEFKKKECYEAVCNLRSHHEKVKKVIEGDDSDGYLYLYTFLYTKYIDGVEKYLGLFSLDYSSSMTIAKASQIVAKQLYLTHSIVLSENVVEDYYKKYSSSTKKK